MSRPSDVVRNLSNELALDLNRLFETALHRFEYLKVSDDDQRRVIANLSIETDVWDDWKADRE